jgi:hypothetical protein
MTAALDSITLREVADGTPAALNGEPLVLEPAPWDDDVLSLGTCAGCGTYGRVGRTHYRDGAECGEYV